MLLIQTHLIMKIINYKSLLLVFYFSILLSPCYAQSIIEPKIEPVEQIPSQLEMESWYITPLTHNSYRVYFYTNLNIKKIKYLSRERSGFLNMGRRSIFNFDISYKSNKKDGQIYLVYFILKPEIFNGKNQKKYQNFIRKKRGLRIIKVKFTYSKFNEKERFSIKDTTKTGKATTTNEVPDGPTKK